MAKKVASFSHNKKRPIKHSNKRRKLRTIFQKIFNYMKSDTYMFSPLIHPQSPANFSPSSLEFGKPIKEKEKKLVQAIEGYLKCDYFMYSPVVADSDAETTIAPTGRIGSVILDFLAACFYFMCLVKKFFRFMFKSGLFRFTLHSFNRVPFRGKENLGKLYDQIELKHNKTIGDVGDTMGSLRDIVRDNSYTPKRRIAINHELVRKENAEHVIRQNCFPTSISGKGLLQKETRNIVVE